MLTGCR